MTLSGVGSVNDVRAEEHFHLRPVPSCLCSHTRRDTGAAGLDVIERRAELIHQLAGLAQLCWSTKLIRSGLIPAAGIDAGFCAYCRFCSFQSE